MKDIKVASRYAKSLLDLSLEKGQLEKVKDDMLSVHQSIKESRELELLLANPIVKTDKKLAVLNEIFKDKLGTISLNFIQLITSKKRENYIFEIAQEFISQYKKHKHILTAVITTTSGLDNHLRNQVLDLIKQQSHQEIELIEKTDKNIIGGFILNIGDKQIDSSVSGKLAKLRKTITENPYTQQ